MYGHPGKKSLFMGGELAQWSEWNYAGYLDWFLLDSASQADDLHRSMQALIRDLNQLLRSEPTLYECDTTPEGFAWIDGSDTKHSVIAFMRYARGRTHPLIFVCNFTPEVRYGYRIGVPLPGSYVEFLNTDAEVYGGSNVGNLGRVRSEAEPMHGFTYSVALTLPPLAVIGLRPAGRTDSTSAKPSSGRRKKSVT
jgi:1,4-alpha-glucan branching enzyme